MNILFFGDIVGRNGIKALSSKLPKLIKEFSADFVIANGENASKGKGLTEYDYESIIYAGVDVITLGNHYRSKNQIDDYIGDVDGLIRPANVKNYCCGEGSSVYSVNGVNIRITNLLTQGFMREDVYSPILCLEAIVNQSEPCIHIVDLHGESTSEKKMIGYYFDGRVSAIIGTHTHVQTNDDQILPNGTAFISDVGMCGSLNSVIGFDPKSVINKFINKQDIKISIDDNDDEVINGIFLNIDENTFECLDIEKIRINLRR